MATNLFHQLSITAASATLGLAVFNSLPATAAIVTYDFEFKYFETYPEALLETPITGSFSYDESSFQAGGFVGLDLGDPISSDKPTIRSFSTLEDCYLNAFFPDTCGYDAGGEVSLTDFQINFSGITFTKQNAEKFNIIWNMKQFINYPLGSFQRTGLAGSATWNNPYLNLNFSRFGPLGNPLDFLPDSPRGYYVELSTSLPTSLTSFITVESEFTRRNTTATEIPEGPKEPALLGLGLLGLAKLLKRKIASSLPS